MHSNIEAKGVPSRSFIAAAIDKSRVDCYCTVDLPAPVAQLAEHIHGKDEVNGSIPFGGSRHALCMHLGIGPACGPVPVCGFANLLSRNAPWPARNKSSK